MELCTLVQKIEIKNVFLHCSQGKQPTLISLDYITTAPPPNLTLLLQNTARYAGYKNSTSYGYFILATDPWSQGSQWEEMSANNFSEQSARTCHFELSQFQVISSFTVISQLRQPACSLVTSHKRRLNAAFLTWNKQATDQKPSWGTEWSVKCVGWNI